jgi:hypothetical protein
VVSVENILASGNPNHRPTASSMQVSPRGIYVQTGSKLANEAGYPFKIDLLGSNSGHSAALPGLTLGVRISILRGNCGHRLTGHRIWAARLGIG